MKRLTLAVDALVVESFPIGSIAVLAAPTTAATGMRTNERGCTLPELCGTTPLF